MQNNTSAVLSDNIMYIAEQVLELMHEAQKGCASITPEERELLHDVMMCARSVVIKCSVCCS